MKISPFVDPLWSGEREVWKRRLFVKAQWEAETEREKFGAGKREKAVGGVFCFTLLLTFKVCMEGVGREKNK